MNNTQLLHLMKVNTSNPEDARRGNLLSVLIAGCILAAMLGVLFLIGGMLAGLWVFSDAIPLIDYMAIYTIVLLTLIVINHYWSRTAIYLFTILFILAVMFCDTPYNLSNGNSIIYLTIPLITASLFIHPLGGFGVAVIGCGIITWYNSLTYPGSSPNFITMISLFVLALIAWLVTNSLEQALKQQRETNASLDRMVKERTQELADALQRERLEAGRNRAILESIADGVIVFDHNGRAVTANPACVGLLEIQMEKISGAGMAELALSHGVDEKNRLLLAGLLTAPQGQVTGQHILWGKKTLSVSPAPVSDPTGAFAGTVVVFHDYSHEAELQVMKNTFLAIASHELRTPLNTMRGDAEMLKAGFHGPVNEKQSLVADRIMRDSGYLLELVRDLLDQAQMETGRLPLHEHPFRPADLVEDVHMAVDTLAAEKRLTLTGELDPRLPASILGDKARLQQILVNLLNNSIKFTPSGSVHFSLRLAGKKTWVIEVQDTGIGINKDDLPIVFEAFRQGDHIFSRGNDGFGLGLTIVKQLCELMGGSVDVTSREGSGSLFVVTLPLVRASQA